MKLSRQVWIGGLSKNELLQNLTINNIGINEFGMWIFNHNDFITSPIREALQTVEISVGDLGFPDGATTEQVYQKAKELDLGLCPYELAPHMRLQYQDFNQPIDPPKGNWQTIATKQLFDELDFSIGFYLRRREDGFWLRGYRASQDHLWTPDDRFIFVEKI